MTSPRYVRVRKFAEIGGYTEKAIYRKVEEGVWVLGHEYRRAPRRFDLHRY
ncbi:MAG: Excisionase [Bradyrhizobium sp.]|nr:Excisionase [Bradyrhizobium sp.]